jgi:hypothetical protein
MTLSVKVSIHADDSAVPLDEVLIEHRRLRKQGTDTEYSNWINGVGKEKGNKVCPMLIPFTTFREVTISGQGTHQGGTAVLRTLDKEVKDSYYKAAAEEAGIPVGTAKVCANQSQPIHDCFRPWITLCASLQFFVQ